MSRCPILALSIMLLAAAPAAAQDTENQLWPEIDAFIKLNPKTRLFLLYGATRVDNVNSYSDGQLGGYIDFYSFRLLGAKVRDHVDMGRNRTFMLRAGYSTDRSATDSSVTQMPSIEAHARVMLPGQVLLSDRNRVDFRVVNGDYRPRYRNRIKFERTFKHGRLEVNPYAHFELFYGFKTDTINRYRFSAGMEWTLTKHIVAEGYYARQVDSPDASRSYVNALGLVAQFYFR